MSEGAADAAFVELWNGIVLVGGDLVCVAADGRLGEVLDRVKAANNGSLGGFPDVLAIFEDGRVAFREAKSVSGKDKLQPNQHAMADLLRREFGSNADFAVVEWDCPDGSDQRGA